MVKITIEKDGETVTLEFEQIHWVEERGVIAGPSGDGLGRREFEPNGHRRHTLKAWSGIPKFDHFRTDCP